MPAAPTSRTRLTRVARREQLLDAAGRLLVAQGFPAVTMERVAEWAGVSKALPYAHFDNSDDVLVALHRRVVGELGHRMIEALDAAEPDQDRVPVLVRAYLDTVADLGPVLGAVTAPGSPSAELADRNTRVGRRFVTGVLVTYFGLSEERARGAAPILLAALTGAVMAWRDRDARRPEVEAMSIAVVDALIR